MGWNSWDSYGTTVREAQVKANADWMAAHLAKYGWQYIVVDIQCMSRMRKGTITNQVLPSPWTTMEG